MGSYYTYCSIIKTKQNKNSFRFRVHGADSGEGPQQLPSMQLPPPMDTWVPFSACCIWYTSESAWTHCHQLKSTVSIRFTLFQVLVLCICGYTVSRVHHEGVTEDTAASLTSCAPPFHPSHLNSWQPLVCFFLIYIFYWSTVAWQCFRCIAEWFNYTYIHILFLKLFSIIDYYKILTIVPCAI